MSYFKYIDNGRGPTKLFLGGVHGNEGKTSIKFIKSIKQEDLSCGQFYFYNFDKTDYISTIKKEYYESELGQKVLELIEYFEPEFYTELHCYDLKNYDKLTSMERYLKTGVPPLIPAGNHVLVSSVSPLIRMTYFSKETVCKTLEFPCLEKLTPEIMEEFNFDEKLAIDRYMDLLRLITKCETRIDFENTIMKKYRPQVKLISIILILILVQTALQLMILNLFNVSLGYVETENVRGVIHNGELMVVLTIILVLLLIASTILSNKVSSNAAYRTRQKIFHILTHLPLEEINNFKYTGLMSRTTRGVFSEQGFLIIIFRELLPVPFITIGVIIEIYLIDPDFAVYFTIYVAIFLLLFLFRMKKIVEIYFKAKKTYGTINQLFRDKILGAKTIRIFQKQNFENEKFKKASLNSYDKSVTSLLTQYYVSPIILLIFDITMVIILAYMYLGHSIDAGLTYKHITTLVMDIQYVLYFLTHLAFLPKFVERWPKSYATSVRIEEVLSIEDKIYENDSKVKKSDFKGIEFKNVSFKQNDHEIVGDVSFKIPAGSTIAIVGDASSGKTILMYLLDKLLLLDEGEILINGFDINDCTSRDVRSQISFAMQKDFVLNDTVLNNIRMGDENITEDMVVDACEKTGLDELLRNKNLDLDTVITENESNISGEFKNKLTLTRAIVRDRDIYIFDDYTFVMENKTNIILTQNADQISDIDHIVVLENGKVVGEGSHEKLISDCEVYQKLYLGVESC